MLFSFCLLLEDPCIYACSSAQHLTSPRFSQPDVFPCWSLLPSWVKERVLIAEHREEGKSTFWLWNGLVDVQARGHCCATVDIEEEASCFLWVATDGKSPGFWFQDALVCCSSGVRKYCTDADKLMTWKTRSHKENVRVWRAAWWLWGRVLWVLPLIPKVLE